MNQEMNGNGSCYVTAVLLVVIGTAIVIQEAVQLLKTYFHYFLLTYQLISPDAMLNFILSKKNYLLKKLQDIFCGEKFNC
jgi:hypothetical protein